MTTTPHTHPDLYRTVVIDGQPSPGKVTLSGYQRKHDWEVKKPSGSKGAVTNNKGPDNSGFTASFDLADFEQVEAWDTFQRMLAASVEGPKPRALSIYHPDLARNKIVDCVVAEIGDMAHQNNGRATVVCKFIEYRPPKPKPVVKAEAGAARTVERADPNAARKAELAALLEQAKQP